MLLGVLNARVGVLGLDEECMRGVVRRHGLDDRNEDGEELLQFNTLNQLTVMNTGLRRVYDMKLALTLLLGCPI